MSVYTNDILTAIWVFPLLAVLLTLPFMLYNYHRYGAVSKLRSLILCSFLFYLLCAYFMVILPLPSREEVAQLTTPYVQLIPFHFVVDFLQQTPLVLSKPSTYLAALKDQSFLQPVFNLLLTLPFGAYLSYYFGKSLKKTILFSFLLSLFFELTQLTGLYGIYPRSYRLFDVDDLMMNTLGGWLGYYVGRVFVRILPSRRQMDEKSRILSGQVSFTRRAVALFVDGMILVLLLTGIEAWSDREGRWMLPVLYLLYFVGISCLWRGRTPGKALVHIRVAGANKPRPLWAHLLLRYALLYLPLGLAQAGLALSGSEGAFWSLLVLLGIPLMGLLMVIDFFRSMGRDKRLWYERWSDTALVNILPGSRKATS